MDPRIKNALGAIGALALILTSIAAWQGAGAFARSAPAYATVSVSGMGEAVGIPDVAEFTFSIISEGGKDVAALQKQNIDKANAAIDFVKSQGVEAKDIKTLAYNIEPRYQNYSCRPSTPVAYPGGAEPAVVQPCPPSEIVGYTVRQMVHVKVRDFSKTGDLLSGVASRGANDVSGLTFSVDNPSALQNEARGKAIQEAKRQAEAMAKAGGFRLGRLVSVDEGYSYQPYYKGLALESRATGMGGDAAAPSPSIEPGSQEYSTEVTLTYEIR